jgi:hypothetical protein
LAIVDLLIHTPKTRALVERAASLLGVLLGGGDDIRLLVAAVVADRSRSWSSNGDVRVADTDTSTDADADADARSQEAGIKRNRGWGSRVNTHTFCRERDREWRISALVKGK